MSKTAPILKDETQQRPVPSVWRSTFYDIVEAFKDGDYRVDRGIAGVRPISEEDARRIARNIESYGAHVSSLPEETWNTSVCQWMRGYWDVLVDLFTIEEGASDLVLVARVYEQDQAYVFEVESVHVP